MNILTGGQVYNSLQNKLPTISSADAGKVLTVDENGNWVAR